MTMRVTEGARVMVTCLENTSCKKEEMCECQVNPLSTKVVLPTCKQGLKAMSTMSTGI